MNQRKEKKRRLGQWRGGREKGKGKERRGLQGQVVVVEFLSCPCFLLYCFLILLKECLLLSLFLFLSLFGLLELVVFALVDLHISNFKRKEMREKLIQKKKKKKTFFNSSASSKRRQVQNLALFPVESRQGFMKSEM